MRIGMSGRGRRVPFKGRALGGASVLALLVAAVVAAGCGGDDDSAADASAGETQDLTVMLDWTPNPQQGGLHVAQEAGYFEDNGLNVKLQPPPETQGPAKFVATEEVDLGVYYEPDTIVAREKGLDIVAVGSLIPTPLASLAYASESGITDVAGLEGKTVGSFSLPMNTAMLESILADADLSIDDVDYREMGFSANNALRANRVDAVIGTFWTSQPDTAPDAEFIPVNEVGIPTYDEMVIIANSERLANDPSYKSAVEGFMKATQDGLKDMIAEPEEFATLMKDVSAENPDTLEEQAALAVEAATPPEGREPGCLDADGWSQFSDWMADQGMIKAPVPADDVISTDYVPGCDG